MSTLILQNGAAQVEVASLGAQVLCWSLEKTQILYVGTSPRRGGIPLLFPFADPLTNDTLEHTSTRLPQHGFGREVQWELERVAAGHVRATLRSNKLPHVWQEKFPYLFETTLDLRLEARGRQTTLSYTWRTKNSGTDPLPLAPGLHPYFPLPHFAKSTLATDPELNLAPLDTAEELPGGLYHPYADLQATFPNFTLQLHSTPRPKHLVAWSQSPSKPDTDFICLEPFTRGPNGINDDPIWVEPGEAWTWEFGFQAIVNGISK